MVEAWSMRGVKAVLVLLALGLSVYIVGPPLFWQFTEGLNFISATSSPCSPCDCDCPSSSSSLGLANLTLPDCGNNDPQVKVEMSKNLTDLLTEELRLHRTVAEENQQHSEIAVLEAKRLGSQYQKEAEKCNAGMETCEGARERAAKLLVGEKKLAALWEQRARQMGWKDA